MFTMSDKGSENFAVANANTIIRRTLDPLLQEIILHRWMPKHSNIKPEIFWSGFRRNWTPGFEKMFAEGEFDGAGHYDQTDPLQ